MHCGQEVTELVYPLLWCKPVKCSFSVSEPPDEEINKKDVTLFHASASSIVDGAGKIWYTGTSHIFV